MKTRGDASRPWYRTALVGGVLLAMLAAVMPQALADSVTVPDSGPAGNGFDFPSMVLDANGFPIVAYTDRADGQLKVLHCDDPVCDGVGDSITTPDPSMENHGSRPSMVLDSAGNPVIVYSGGNGVGSATFFVLHCDDPNCDGVESITSPDPSASVSDAHVVLDSAGNPVIVYGDSTFGAYTIHVMHCDDPNCDGGGETISDVEVQDVTTPGRVYRPGTLALDSAGNPMFTYFREGAFETVLMVCNDPDCAGMDEVISPLPGVGSDLSMAIDSAGNPVFAFQSQLVNSNDISVLHCDDPVCDGTGDSVTTPDTRLVGFSVSMQLDAAGNPVIAYYEGAINAKLTVMHCDDPNCSGIEARSAVDQVTNPNHGISLALDASGYPVVAHLHFDDGELRIVHCDDVECAPSLLCAGLPVTIDMNTGIAGMGTSGDDVILGTPGDDVIDGGGGDDTICGEDGDDTISGGAGSDVIIGGEDNDIITGGAGVDRIRGQKGDDDISGGADGDFIYGGTGSDTLNGGDGDDVLGGFGGDDMIDAGPGDDVVFGGFGADTINGGDGDDWMRGLIGNDIINGDAGNDELFGDNGLDTIDGGVGNDKIQGGNSTDTVMGGVGDDTVAGGKANDTLSGGAGIDTCAGNTGTDSADATCETIFGVP